LQGGGVGGQLAQGGVSRRAARYDP
jgi:hypothetical protein